MLCGQADVFAVIDYKVYKEYVNQFDMKEYPQSDVKQLDAVEYDAGFGLNFFYMGRFDYPYGEIDIKVKWELSD